MIRVLVKPQGKPNGGEEFALEFIERVKDRHLRVDGKWHPYTWAILGELLTEEGDTFSDAGPCSARIYEYLLGVTYAYLKEFPDRARLQAVNNRVRKCLGNMREEYKKMPPEAYFQDEVKLLSSAVGRIELLLQASEKRSSDTS